MEIATQHLHMPVPPLREKVPSLPINVEHMVMRDVKTPPGALCICTRLASALKLHSCVSLTSLLGPGSLSLPSLPRTHADTSLHLSSADFQRTAISLILSPYLIPGTHIALGSGTPPSQIAKSLPILQHVSRRKVIAGLIKPQSGAWSRFLVLERLLNPLFQPRTSILP